MALHEKRRAYKSHRPGCEIKSKTQIAKYCKKNNIDQPITVNPFHDHPSRTTRRKNDSQLGDG
jgi:hypothetical protein